MTMTEVESFYTGGNRAGALVRYISSDVIETTLIFRVDGGPVVHLFQQTRFTADVFNWNEYQFVDHLEGTDLDIQADEHAFGDRLGLALPSYATHLVLKAFLLTGEPRREFAQFNESTPSEITPAAFVRHGIETVETPSGPLESMKVVLEIDGLEGNSFWCVDGSVVKSDWQGAESYATADPAVVLHGLDSEVQTLLKSVLPTYSESK